MRKFFIYIRFLLKALLNHPHINTFRAIFKFAGSWYRFNDQTKSSDNETIPWLCFSDIDQIKKILHRDMIIFEYGSGGSTLFSASRVKEVVSVEHDRIWYEKMKTELSNHNIPKIQYILSEAGRGRPSRLLHTWKKVKKQEYLIVDNSERNYYLFPFKFKEPNWRILKFYGPVPLSLFGNHNYRKKNDPT